MSSFNFCESRPPTLREFREFARRASSTGPGRDGFPYALYCNSLMSEALFNVWRWMVSGHQPPEDFNDVIMFFPPKGKEPDDFSAVIRAPAKARPIGLRNTDNKISLAMTTRAHQRE